MIEQRPIDSHYLQPNSYQEEFETVDEEDGSSLNEDALIRIKHLEDYIFESESKSAPYRKVIYTIIIWLFMYSFNILVLNKIFTGKPKVIFLEIIFVTTFFLVVSYLLELI